MNQYTTPFGYTYQCNDLPGLGSEIALYLKATYPDVQFTLTNLAEKFGIEIAPFILLSMN